jgi:hypothetical protein
MSRMVMSFLDDPKILESARTLDARWDARVAKFGDLKIRCSQCLNQETCTFKCASGRAMQTGCIHYVDQFSEEAE